MKPTPPKPTAGGKDKCTKGISCGLACISRLKDCTVNVSKNTAEVIDDLTNKIRQQAAAGAGSGDKKKKQSFDKDEALAIATRPDGLLESQIDRIKTQVEATANLGNIVRGDLSIGTSDDEITTIASGVYNNLPAKLQNKISRNGSPGQWHAEDGSLKPTKEMTKADWTNRGIEVIKQYVKQGGIDAYTLEPEALSILDMDVEHIRPLNGKPAGTDSPENWVLVRGGINKLRGNRNLMEFTRSAYDWASLSPEQKLEKLAKQQAAKQTKQAARKSEYLRTNLSSDDASVSGHNLNARTERHIGTNKWPRIGRGGTTDIPTELKKELITLSAKHRATQNRPELSGYSPDMSKSDFTDWYSDKVTTRKNFNEQRVANHAKGVDQTEMIKDDLLTDGTNQAVFKPYYKIQEARQTASNSQDYNRRDSRVKWEQGMRAQLTKDGVASAQIDSIINKAYTSELKNEVRKLTKAGVADAEAQAKLSV